MFFKEMQLPEPDYNLGIFDCTHGAMVGRMLEKIEEVILYEKADIVLVYGDADSTLAGALAAVKLHISVAHVEAGLRSYNKKMPEEIDRILTDHVSNILFCPTESAVKNLCKEGFTNFINKGKLIKDLSVSSFFQLKSQSLPLVVNVGDVMYDAVLFYKEAANTNENIKRLIDQIGDPFYLATVHRAENTDDPERLSNIMAAFERISETIPVVLPLHPRTRRLLNSYNIIPRKIRLIEPVSYLDMITLLESCKAVFTDSGGLQKEAYFFRKPCITLRNETEWTELIAGGYNTLVDANQRAILGAEKNISDKYFGGSVPLYGYGDAGIKIVQIFHHLYH